MPKIILNPKLDTENSECKSLPQLSKEQNTAEIKTKNNEKSPKNEVIKNTITPKISPRKSLASPDSAFAPPKKMLIKEKSIPEFDLNKSEIPIKKLPPITQFLSAANSGNSTKYQPSFAEITENPQLNFATSFPYFQNFQAVANKPMPLLNQLYLDPLYASLCKNQANLQPPK